MFSKRKSGLFILIALLILGLSGCGSNSTTSNSGTSNQQSTQKKFVRLGGGIGGSSWEVTAGKVAEMMSKYVPNLSVTAQPGGMGENLGKLARKEIQIAVVYNFALKDALEGNGSYKNSKNPDLRYLAALYPSYEQILVPKNSPLNTIKDLAKDPGQLKIAALTPGSGTYIMIDTVLKAVGTSLDDVKAKGGLVQPVDYEQGVTGLKNNTINVLPVNGPPNSPSIQEYESDGKFLTFDDETLKKISEIQPGAVSVTFPGTYKFLTTPYKTFAIYTSLAVNADVPDQDVYNITKALWDNIADFKSVADFTKETSLETAMNGATVPIHPGALKYYNEKGIKQPGK